MRTRLLALLLVPAVTVLLLATNVLQERNETYGEAKSATELAALAQLVSVLDQRLGEEALAGTKVIEDPDAWPLFVRRQIARTDRSLAALRANESIDDDVLQVLDTGLAYRSDMQSGTISPLQLLDRYAGLRQLLLDALADRARLASGTESGAPLQGLFAMIEARSAHLNERLASELALTYETWAPGQHTTAVGAAVIQQDRIEIAAAERRRAQNRLPTIGVLEDFREQILLSASVPDIPAHSYARASDAWMTVMNFEIVAETRAINAELAIAEQNARNDRLGTTVGVSGALAFTLLFAGTIAYRIVHRVELIAERAESFADGTLILSATREHIGGRDEIAHLAAVFDDMARRVDRQARHDALTGLPNRKSILDQCTVSLDGPAGSVAVLAIDLDDFKPINDRLGHHAGDQALREVANRLQRIADGQNGIAGRLGGDEFLVVLRNLDPDVDLRRLAQRYIHSLQAPIRLGDTSVRVGVSIGIARQRPETGSAALLREADDALYVAKANGRGQAVLSDDALRDRLASERAEQETIRAALDAGEFVPFFQPLWYRGTKLTAFEALVRWQRPDGSVAGPGAFLPAIEQQRLLPQLDTQVFRSVCETLMDWQAGGLPVRPVSVNVSSARIEHPDFVADVVNTLEQTGCPAELIMLEVTESGLMTDITSNAHRLQTLRDLGIRIGADDFGTGYSSLGYLSGLPIDGLKLDRIFIDRIDTNPANQAIVRNVISMAADLGLSVVAEGVEREEEFEWLVANGTQILQGFLLGRPAPISETAALLATLRSTPESPQVPSQLPADWIDEVEPS